MFQNGRYNLITSIFDANCDSREAKDLGLMDESFVWITTDATTSSPNDMAYTGSFPSFYQGILGTLPNYGQDTDSFKDLVDEYVLKSNGSASDFKMSSMKVLESLRLIHASLIELDKQTWDAHPVVQCSSGNSWAGGKTLGSKLNETFYKGNHHLEGTVLPTYNVMNFYVNGFESVGKWQEGLGLLNLKGEQTVWRERTDILFLGGVYDPPTGICKSFSGHHLKIGIVPEAPIAYKNDSCDPVDISSPHCWYGWNPEIIEQLSHDLNFTYEYVMPDDKKYGGMDEHEEWNGMVGDLIAKKTDLTTALTVNTLRLGYIGYTMPFHEEQAAFVMLSKSSSSSSNRFFFLEPFDFTVWVTILGLILLIGAVISFLNKLSPYGHYGRKIHAMQICQCIKCKARRTTKIKMKCRFEDAKTYECLKKKSANSNYLCDLSVYNSTWLTSTGN